MTDELRIEAETEVPNCPNCGMPNQDKWLNNIKKVNALTANSNASNPLQPENNDSKSVYNGDIHPEYETAACENCRKYAQWLGYGSEYNTLHLLPKFYSGLPLPIRSLYEEAIASYEESPERARELLYRATRDLSIYLGEKGDDLYVDLINLLSQKFTDEEIARIVSSSKDLLNDMIEPSEHDPLENLNVLNELFNSFIFVAGVMNHELMHIRDKMKQEKKTKIPTRINKTA